MGVSLIHPADTKSLREKPLCEETVARKNRNTTAPIVMKILPNRSDAFVLISGVLLVLTLLSVWSLQSGLPSTVFFFPPPAIGLSALCLAAVGAVVAWHRQSTFRAIVLALLSLVCLASTFVMIMSADHKGIEGFALGYQVVESKDFITNWIYLACYSLANFFIAFGGVWLIRFLPRFVVAQKNRLKLNRSRLLIAFAVGLFSIVFVNNLLSRSGIIHNDPRVAIWTLSNFWFATIGLAILFWLVVYYPSRVMTQRSRWHQLFMAFFFVFLLAVIPNLDVVITYFGNRGFIPFESLWPLFLTNCGAVFWLLALMGLTDSTNSNRKSVAKLESDEGPIDSTGVEFKSSKQNVSSRPTVWSGLIVLALCCVFFVPRFFDLSILFEQNLLEDRWQTAWNSSKIHRESIGQIKLGTSSPWYTPISTLKYRCDFNEDVDPNIFSRIDTSTAVDIEIISMQPTVDTSMIRPLEKQVSVSGTVTGKQLGDLCFNTQQVEIGEVVFSTDEKTRLENFERIVIRTAPGGVARLLQSVEFQTPVKLNSFVQIGAPINKADWEAIIDASQYCKFVIDRNVGYLIDEPNMNCRNITFDLNYLENLNFYEDINYLGELKEAEQLVVTKSNAKISCSYHSYAENERLFWDWYFALPGRILAERYYGTYYEEVASEEFARECHWIYGMDAQQNATKMFVPELGFLLQLEGFTELKTLSFDERWVGITPADYFHRSSRRRMWGGVPVDKIDPAPLSGLTKLESLSFPSSCVIEDATFLKKLTSLQDLQIPCSFQFTRNLPNLPSLESLTLFGKPTPNLIPQLQNLPKLKRLVVVDVNEEETMDEKFVADLKKSLAGVEVVVLSEHDFKPDVPEEFQQYLSGKSAQLLEKISDE
jgi:hypothetical protein